MYEKLKHADDSLITAEGVGLWASSQSKSVVRRNIFCAGDGDGDTPCPMFAAKSCRRVMMLQCIVLGVPKVGVYQIDTSSINSISNVVGFLEFMKQAAGRIAGIEFTLSLVPRAVSPDGKKKTVHVLDLSGAYDLRELLAGSVTQPVAAPEAAQLQAPPIDESKPEDLFPGADPEDEPDVTSETSAPVSETTGGLREELLAIHITNLGDLGNAVKAHFNLTLSDAVKEAGYGSVYDISDAAQAWRRIVALHTDGEVIDE